MKEKLVSPDKDPAAALQTAEQRFLVITMKPKLVSLVLCGKRTRIWTHVIKILLGKGPKLSTSNYSRHAVSLLIFLQVMILIIRLRPSNQNRKP